MYKLSFAVALLASMASLGGVDIVSPDMILTDPDGVPIEAVIGSTTTERAMSKASKLPAGTYKLIRAHSTITASLPPASADIGLPKAPEPKETQSERGSNPEEITGFEFSQLPGDVRSVFPSNEELGIWKGVSGPYDVFNWNGATVYQGKMWFWGGGHAGYGGNEFYAYDLTARSWERIGPWLEPHTVDASGCYDPPAGNPISMHTMSGIFGANGRIYVGGYSGYCDGRSNSQRSPLVSNFWSFDIATQTWRAETTLNMVEAHFAYDEDTDLLYVWSRRSRLDVYRLATGELLQHNSGPVDYVDDDAQLIIDKARGQLYGVHEGTVYAWPIRSDGLLDVTTATVSPELIWAGNGFLLHDGMLWVWGGKNWLVKINPDTWEKTEFLAESNIGGPSSNPTNRVSTRFQIDPTTSYFIGFSTYDSLWQMRPIGAEVPSIEPPPVTGWAIDPLTAGGLATHDPTAAMPVLSVNPTGLAGLHDAMQTTGDNPAIGVVTAWQAALLAGRMEYRDQVLQQASAEARNMLRWDAEHTYPLYWVAYLLTGEQQYIDRLKDYYQTYMDWRGRPFEMGIVPLREREMAWQLRTLAELATVDPAYQLPLDNTLSRLTTAYMNGGRPGRQVIHTVGPAWSTSEERLDPKHLGTSVFQQAFVTQTLAHVVMLGHEEWRPLLEWNFYFWRRMIDEDYLRMFDINNLWYWTEAEGDKTTWEEIMGELPQSIIDDGVRHLRGAQALVAIGYCAKAGVPGAVETFNKLKPLVYSRAARLNAKVNVRDAVLPDVVQAD